MNPLNPFNQSSTKDLELINAQALEIQTLNYHISQLTQKLESTNQLLQQSLAANNPLASAIQQIQIQLQQNTHPATTLQQITSIILALNSTC